MKTRILTLSFLAAFLFCSCGDPIEPEPVKLVATPSQLSFDAAGGTQELVLTSGIKPEISCSDNWITLSEGAYASNTVTLRVSAQENTGTAARSTSIRVIGEKQSLMIPVSQGIPQVKLAVSETRVSFDRFGGEAEFTVTSSQKPQVSSDAAWCGVAVGEIGSNHETTVTLLAGANRTTDPRDATVTVKCGSESLTVSVSGEAGKAIPVTSAAALTPKKVFSAMAPGWNMGNQMDAISNGISGETLWGNDKCTQATFDGVKAAGFKAVRICVTWEGHIGPAPAWRLEENWLARVEEIVGYAEKAGLVAIVNTHHDESYWLDIAKAYNNASRNEQINEQIFNVWTQIALRFKDKGEWLVFESFNEIQDGGWGWSEAFKSNPEAQYKVLNGWNQMFVDAVRSTGGNNATRWLGIPGYAANPGFTIAGLVLPTDYTGANRLIVAVHDYDPYNYTLADPLVRQWGHTADPALRCSDKDEENVVAVFDQLKTAYLDNGIPVYLGEMGCSRHGDADFPYQKYYMEYFCKAAADRLLPMYLWDNGAKGTGPETHCYINHGTGAFADDKARELVDLMVKAVTKKDASYTLESVYNAAP